MSRLFIYLKKKYFFNSLSDNSEILLVRHLREPQNRMFRFLSVKIPHHLNMQIAGTC
jgi:hypothetical protein